MAQSDKPSIVIRAHPILRWGSLGMAGIFAIQLVWLMRQLLLFPSIDGSLLFTILLPIGADCLMIGLLIYYVILGWTMALIFDTTQLALRTIPLSSYRPFRIAYSEIVKVERAVGGYAFQIVTNRNAVLRFAGFEFEGGLNRPLMELAGRLPAEKFSDEALAAAQHKSRWTSAMIVFQTIGTPLILAVVLMGSGQYPSPLPTAWHKADLQVGLPSVRGVAADPDGSIWLLSDLGTEEYHIRHVSDGKPVDWAFPEEFAAIYRLGIARDRAGNPWVIDAGSIHRWDGTAWQTQAYPEGVRIGGWITVDGTTVWAVTYGAETKRIVKLDIGDGNLQTQFVDLPEGALGADSEIEWMKPGPDGSLAIAVADDSHYAFYLWEGGSWRKIADLEEERMTIFGGVQIDRDESGNIYVTQWYRKDGGRHAIGIFRPEQSAWNWSDVYFLDDKETLHQEVEQLLVDSSGRLWMVMKNNINHYTERSVCVFLEQGGEFHEIRHYTKDNSGMSGMPTLMAGNGRIWAVWDYAAWIDSRQQDLPQPLPEWLAFITGDAGFKARFVAEMILFFIIIALAIYMAVRPPWLKRSRPKED